MMTKTARVRALSVLAGLAYTLGLAFIYCFRGGEYDWMLEMDPGLGKAPPSTGDWVIFAQMGLAFALATQVPMLFTRNRKYHAVMIVVAVIIYWLCDSH